MKTSLTRKKLLRGLLALVTVVCMLMCTTVFASADIAAVQKVADSVLQMNFSVKSDSGKEYKIPSGTGFLINEDTILTCYHVIDPDYLAELFVSFYGIDAYNQLDLKDRSEAINNRVTYSVTVARDVTVNATYLNGSEVMDFAIMKLSQPIKGRNYIALRDSKDVKAAEIVYALGFPAISDAAHEVSSYTKNDVTFSSGVVSKPQDLFTFSFDDGSEFKGQFLQTTCMINSGNSGGPMVDENGTAVGISSIGQNDSFFYGVAISQVIDVLDALGVEYAIGNASEPVVEPTAEPEPTPEPTAEPIPVVVDYAALDSSIEEANALDEKAYTKESYEALWNALSEARKAKSSDSQSEVNTAVENLNRAIRNLEQKQNNNMLYIIIAAAAAVVVIVVVVLIVVSRSKKSEPKKPVAKVGTAVNAGGTSSFNAPPVTPARSGGAVASSDIGATTILRGKVEATTVLANGGTITRVKNGDKLDIRVQEILVGRDSNSCSFWISGNSNISSKHAKFAVKGGTTYICDCNSTNGTFVNGTKLQPNVEVALKDGDRITLADEDFRFSK